jgi:hypothetical protein
MMVGNLEVEPALLRPSVPVLDVMREALLTGVEIEAGDVLARLHQCDRQMYRHCGLAGATFLVTDDNHARTLRLGRCFQ